MNTTSRTRRSPRYTVRATRYGVALTAHGDLAFDMDHFSDGQPVTRHYWVSPSRSGMGSVYDTTHNPGTSGQQVCKYLYTSGATLAIHPQDLAACIRAEAAARCAKIDRATARTR